MSNTTPECQQACDFDTPDGGIALLIEPRETDLGGFKVRRTLPNRRCRQVGPWIFFDHMGPAEFAAGEGVNVAPHPHINLATVTYLFEGELLHRDSLGTEQVIRPGDINLMVAGRGIAHSEREPDAVRNRPHRVEGLQLWLALPDADEEMAPEFLHYPQNQIPRIEIQGGSGRLIMGQAFGQQSPVKTFAETLYADLQLSAGSVLKLPKSSERALYVAAGEITLEGRALPRHSLAVLNDSAVSISANSESRVIILGGDSPGKRYIDWNFVSSRKARIDQARRDWQEGRFAPVPGDSGDPIPYPDRRK